jgi:hypothetical protein
MAGRGPAPKPADQRRRRNSSPSFRRLSHEGRSGDPPAWPLTTASAAELRQWRKLWSLPQANEWERMRCEDFVSLYCRVLVAVSSDIDNTKLLAEFRHLDAKIGLSPRALLDLRWEIDEAVPEEPVLEEEDHLAFVPDQ